MTTKKLKKIAQMFGINKPNKEYYLNIDNYPNIAISEKQSFNSIKIEVPEHLWNERSMDGVTYTIPHAERIQPIAIEYLNIMGRCYEPFDGFSMIYSFPFGDYKICYSSFFTENVHILEQKIPHCTTIDEYILVQAAMCSHIKKMHDFMRKVNMFQENKTIVMTEDGNRKTYSLDAFLHKINPTLQITSDISFQ